jgi:hypothetical protein
MEEYDEFGNLIVKEESDFNDLINFEVSPATS